MTAMTQESRDFPTAVLASLSSGICLCTFSDMHEAAEYMMGHPIWTHHFADKELWLAIRRTALEQCPGLPVDLPGVTADNYQEIVADIEAQLGRTVSIHKGGGTTAMGPLDGWP